MGRCDSSRDGLETPDVTKRNADVAHSFNIKTITVIESNRLAIGDSGTAGWLEVDFAASLTIKHMKLHKTWAATEVQEFTTKSMKGFIITEV